MEYTIKDLKEAISEAIKIANSVKLNGDFAFAANMNKVSRDLFEAVARVYYSDDVVINK